MTQNDTLAELNPKQVRAIQALVSMGSGDSMDAVAKRAGCARRTIYRWLEDPSFQRAYVNLVDKYLLSQRAKMAKRLVEAAETPGAGQVSALSLYYKLQGQIKDQLEVTVPPAPGRGNATVEALPTAAKQILICLLTGEAIPQLYLDEYQRTLQPAIETRCLPPHMEGVDVPQTGVQDGTDVVWQPVALPVHHPTPHRVEDTGS